ncbi:MAG: folK [Rariglobus sp.]|nr:folK [Rariglobus sp.]
MSPSKPANRVQTAYLGLGGNLGDRRALLSEALARLAAAPEVRIARVSPVYETAALVLPGQPPQPDFLNLVVEIETTLVAHALLDACLAIEHHLGRIRRERWGARTIDLDLLLFGTETLADDRLTIPHPRLHERAFVLAPLADLVPDLVVAGAAIRTHLIRVDRTGVTLRPDLALAPPALLEEIELPCPPHEFFATLAHRDHAFFLDSGLSSGGLGAYSFIGFDPFLIFRAKNNEITLTRGGHAIPPSATSPLTTLQSLLQRHRSATPICHLISDKSSSAFAAPALPFTGGAVGFFSYELCTQLETLPRVRPDDLPEIPDCEFAFYDAFIAHEHATARTWLVANPVVSSPAAALLARLRSALALPLAPNATPPRANPVCHLISDKPDFPIGSKPSANFDFATYSEAISRIKRYIAAGDVYQVNLTQRFETPLFVRLCADRQQLARTFSYVARPPHRNASDQRHPPALPRSRRRRPSRHRTPRQRKGPRRAPHDRRPRTQ